MQVYIFCLQYHISNNVVCVSLCFLLPISHSNYRRMCKFMFSVCNITFQIMSYVQVSVFCLQYHIPRYSHMCRFMFSVCNITFQIMSSMQVYLICLQYHIPNIVICASLCFLFAIWHSKYMQVSIFCLHYHIPNNVVYASLCFLLAISHSK